MRADELKKRLTEELSDMAPNRLDDLLRACEESNRAPRPAEVQPHLAEAPRPRRSMPRLLAAAAVFVLLLGGIFFCIPAVSVWFNRHKRKWYGYALVLVIFWAAVYQLSNAANNPFMYFRF